MKNLVRILIVEDEILISEYIKNSLMKMDYIYLETANTVAEAYKKIDVFLPEIILLDINLENQLDGIDIAKKISGKIPIIFLTAQNDIETIAAALQTQPESYLTKPIKIPDLLAAIQLASLKNTKKNIVIKDGYNEVVLYHNDILYIRSHNNYLDIVTDSRKYTIRNTLDQFLTELDDHTFCRTHRSYVINKNKMTKRATHAVYLNDIEIPISRNYDIEL